MGVSKVQPDDIIKMNELYLKYGTYAAVAREVGFAATTVKKYIVKDFVQEDKLPIIKFSGTIPKAEDLMLPTDLDGWNDWLCLSEEEKEQCDELRKEILL